MRWVPTICLVFAVAACGSDGQGTVGDSAVTGTAEDTDVSDSTALDSTDVPDGEVATTDTVEDIADTSVVEDTRPPGYPQQAPIDEPFPQPVPNAMLPWGGGACTVAGHEIPRFGIDLLDPCTVCQCTWRGGLCSKRASCAAQTDFCVFADGTRAPLGETVRIDGCYRCTCDDQGGSCVRDTEEPCPSSGCQVPHPEGLQVIEPGQERLVSECHQCLCDAELGTLCNDVCHPECLLRGDDEVLLADQARIEAVDGCGSCVCDYGSIECDPRGCIEGCGPAQDCEE